jgi:acyl-homoserine-lactone acylase
MLRVLTNSRPCRVLSFLILASSLACAANAASDDDVARWEREAQNVTIVRDDWGIAHIHGVSDADAVFGMMYAQAEDDFNRVETNYLNALGRLAEAEGESAIYQDLRMKLFIDPDSMQALYARSPGWLQELMNSFADGLNFYLYKHPDVKPRVITHFEPWMALAFSEGSIGGDIERVSLRALESFYGGRTVASLPPDESEPVYTEPTGSNGFAIAPSNTKNGHALLLINPHTSFFFRSELHVSSDSGLNAYGAVTWGQFFVYQGFNERAGWMHTSSGVDVVDEFLESVTEKDGGFTYKYGDEQRPLVTDTITVPYRTEGDSMAARKFVIYKSHHGPIVREQDGKWVSMALMQKPVEALSQSYLRTKAHDYASYHKVAELKANSSNNTIFADADGDIAYMHPQFIPRRNDKFDYTEPVDGSNPATDWNGETPIDSAPRVLNPPNGWIQNTNNWPYSAAGPYSPKREDFPRYMDVAGESPRGRHAIMVLQNTKDFTIESLRAAAFDPYLTAFARLVPPLVKAYDQTAGGNPLKQRVAGQIDSLRAWDFRWSVNSVPTSLAVFWGEELGRVAGGAARRADVSIYDYMADSTTAEQKLQALADASDRLTRDFGDWKTPWGEINRFQRLTGDIVQPFDDSQPSIPVAFTSSRWGSLASFGARPHNGSKKYYGTSGNSFVAVVEFGDSVRAIAVTAGGESGDPASPHFNDQAERYVTGNLRPVYFYPSQLQGHTERTYHPGE